MSTLIRRPFSESSPNVVNKVIFHGSPKKAPSMKKSKIMSSLGAGSKVKKNKLKHKKKKEGSLNNPIKPVSSSKVDKEPRSKKNKNKRSRGSSVITKAAVRRIAAKHDIAQISSDCVKLLADYLTKEANLCLLKARSSALHVSRRKTVTLADLACAAQSCNFGELICV